MSSFSLPTSLRAHDGLALHVSHWPVPDRHAVPRGVVQLVHGLCEHAGRFAETARALNAVGWAAVAIDQRGHGRSGGRRGAIGHLDDLLRDQATLHDAVTQAYPGGVRRVALGWSMGGLVVARLAAARARHEALAGWSRPLDAAILVAPALQPNLNPLQRAMLSTVGRLLPDLQVTVGYRPEWSSSDPAEVAAARGDPLIHDHITPRLGRFLLQAGEAVRQAAPDWRTPTLLLYSHADRLVSAGGCERFAASVPAACMTVQAYQSLAHDLLHEPERRLVWRVITRWLRQHGDVAPPPAPWADIDPVAQRA